MIVKWVLDFVGWVASWVVGLLPTSGGPGASVNGFVSGVATVMSYAAAMSAWIPWSTVGLALAVVGPAVAAAVIIHFVRMVYSMFTGGGGST